MDGRMNQQEGTEVSSGMGKMEKKWCGMHPGWILDCCTFH
jgi:hypothetical protein